MPPFFFLQSEKFLDRALAGSSYLAICTCVEYLFNLAHDELFNLRNPLIKLMIRTNKSASLDLDNLSAYEKFCILDEMKQLRRSATEDEQKIVEMNYLVLLRICGQVYIFLFLIVL